MRSTIIRVALVAIALFLVFAQFVGPERTNPPSDPAGALEANAEVPAPVATVLRRACYNCHSNETTWPLYAHVAPVSWFVIDHVNEGREHLNFSRWGAYNRFERADLLGDACRLARRGDMPLASYLLIHREARLSPSDIAALCEWTQAEAARQQQADAGGVTNGDTHLF